MQLRLNNNGSALGKLARGSVAATLLLLAAPVSWASQECQEYNRITQAQVAIGRMGIKRKDYATPAEVACPGLMRARVGRVIRPFTSNGVGGWIRLNAMARRKRARTR